MRSVHEERFFRLLAEVAPDPSRPLCHQEEAITASKRLLSKDGPGSGAFLSVPPSRKDLVVGNASWSVTLQRRLNVREHYRIVCPVCRRTGLTRDHLVMCPNGGQQTTSHNQVAGELYSILVQEARLPTQKEDVTPFLGGRRARAFGDGGADRAGSGGSSSGGGGSAANSTRSAERSLVFAHANPFAALPLESDDLASVVAAADEAAVTERAATSGTPARPATSRRVTRAAARAAAAESSDDDAFSLPGGPAPGSVEGAAGGGGSGDSGGTSSGSGGGHAALGPGGGGAESRGGDIRGGGGALGRAGGGGGGAASSARGLDPGGGSDFHRRRSLEAGSTYRMDLVVHSAGLARTGKAAFDRKHLCVDVSIADPAAVCHQDYATPGVAAAAAETRKREHYQVDEFDSASYNLIPFVVESDGRWGAAADEFLRGLATHIAGGPSCDRARRARVLCNLRQRLSVALQRQLSGRAIRHLAECRRRQAGGPPAMMAAGELLVGALSMDLFDDA
jgi:hypothetical protein